MIPRVAFAILATLALTRAWKPWPYCAEAEPDPTRAVALHPRSTALRTAYALAQESQGDAAEAERQLLEAAQYDHQYTPAWQLADFYFRHDRKPEFLIWAHLAADRSYGDLSALFRLADAMGVTPERIVSQLLLRPAIERNYVAWLLERHRLPNIGPVARRLATRNTPEDRDMLLAFVDALIQKGDSRSAVDFWRMFEPPEGLLVNAHFEREPLARGFDWRPIAIEGIRQFLTNTLDPSRRGWTIEFSGRQPEVCDLVTQYVVLQPGQTYSLSTESDVPANARASFAWRIADTELPFDATKSSFRATRSLDQIVLRCRRVPGQLRVTGRIEIHSLTLATSGIR